jgi:hypothetical protein
MQPTLHIKFIVIYNICHILWVMLWVMLSYMYLYYYTSITSIHILMYKRTCTHTYSPAKSTDKFMCNIDSVATVWYNILVQNQNITGKYHNSHY